ncbi:MAG: PEP-utilizing enzyme [Nanoarchaeota archaeon]|nr:PEP-utilizing enzyme [Nanoarchaeota archaeon]
MAEVKHLNNYSLIASSHGRKISAYIVKEKNFYKKCNSYLRKNIDKYILGYKQILINTQKVIDSYRTQFMINKNVPIDYKELVFLSELLIENIKLYLISQPELMDVLGDELYKKVKKLKFENVEQNLAKLLQPQNTILNHKENEQRKLIKKIKTGRFSKKEKNKEIFNFYWKYRSFFMIDLNADIEKELQLLKKELNNKLGKRKNKDMKRLSEDLPKEISNLINYIQEVGKIRLEGKNTWMSLTLLIINLIQQISKENFISMNFLENYHFTEIINFLKTKRLNKGKENGEKNLFVLSQNKISQYKGSDFIKLSKLIQGTINEGDQVEGNVAFNGNVKGTAFIVKFQDNLSEKIKEIAKVGNPILIAEQTIPSYLPLIEKSRGIITNEGGILSHAAIISREYKIPAIIGTKIATQVFNNGDKIILDADKGVAYKDKEEISSKEKITYYIVPIKIGKLGVVGGKARNTAILKDIHSLHIPEGIVLTTKLFSEIIGTKNVSNKLKNSQNKESLIKLIHKEIEKYSISPDLIKKLKSLLQDKKKIIVRSSATIEDSSKKSFAGQFVSKVVSVENIEEAIRECFKGAFSLNLLSYIKNVNELSLALLIQEYKEVDKSGVAFSINPTNNYPNEIIVEAVKGGCDKLVSGNVTPETLRLQKNSKKNPKSNILSKNELKILKKKIKLIEESFRTAVDIEWGFEGKKLWIFQTRAITTI